AVLFNCCYKPNPNVISPNALATNLRKRLTKQKNHHVFRVDWRFIKLFAVIRRGIEGFEFVLVLVGDKFVPDTKSQKNAPMLLRVIIRIDLTKICNTTHKSF